MDNQVVYELSLKDMLTGKLHEANSAAHTLEGSIGSISTRLEHVAEGFGISFGLWKGFEWLKDSKELFEQVEFGQSQLEAGLESTRNAAGMTMEDLKKNAFESAHVMKFTEGEIMSMNAILLTFPGITKKTFGDASTAVADMSTRLGLDLKSTAIQVGKALQDPVKGMTALRREGVNFNEAQTEMVKKMVATGHTAQAQQYILNELKNEFAGSAVAAAKADPTFQFTKAWQELSISMGKLVDMILQKITPALTWFVENLKSVAHWVKQNKEWLEPLISVLGGAALAVGAIITVTKIWTGVQWLLNAAITANPIGIMIVAIGAAVGAIIYCYKHFEKFRAVLWAVWATIKEFASIVGDIFMGLWHQIHGVFTLSPSEVVNGFEQATGAVSDAAFRLAQAAKDGYNAGMADFQKDHLAETSNAPKKIGAGGIPQKQPTEVKQETKGARGAKNITMHITIGNLNNGGFTFITKNIQESASKVKEMMIQALAGAVNDSQIVAGG